ncbi:MAG: NAD-dependent epimerase/dehydratase family protein [Paracoccus sp. (in: a-proteobacteria)]|nr:NAD-dependent epimerase/dehydratase family protein [Paracoccus sp. (in: a-proteobacteria)]
MGSNLPPNPTALVTGATGCLGQALCADLWANGWQLRSLSRHATPPETPVARHIALDLGRAAIPDELLAGVDVVFHCAALSSAWGRAADFHAANVTATEDLLAAARRAGVARFVHASTPSIYINGRPRLNLAEDAPLPRQFLTEYARTKYISEQLVRAANGPEMTTVALRPRGIYGRHDRALLPRLLRAVEGGRALPLPGGGTALIDPTHAGDAARAMRLAALAPGAVAGGRAYNITSGQAVRLSELLDLIEQALGRTIPRKSVPYVAAMTAARLAELTQSLRNPDHEPPVTRHAVAALGLSLTLDISAARRDLGYVPQITLAAGMANLTPDGRDGPDPPAGAAGGRGRVATGQPAAPVPVDDTAPAISTQGKRGDELAEGQDDERDGGTDPAPAASAAGQGDADPAGPSPKRSAAARRHNDAAPVISMQRKRGDAPAEGQDGGTDPAPAASATGRADTDPAGPSPKRGAAARRHDDHDPSAASACPAPQPAGNHASQPLPAHARPVALSLRLLRVGHCLAPETGLRADRPPVPRAVPSLVTVLETARAGIILFDTGYGRAWFEATARLPEAALRLATPARLPAQQHLPEALRRLGMPRPARVVLSHLHADHAAGLFDLDPLPPAFASRAALDDLARLTSGRAGLPARLSAVAAALPLPLARRLAALHQTGGLSAFEDSAPAAALPGPLAALGPGYDLTGEGNVITVPLPGHGAGQIGLWLPQTDRGAVLLAADAVYCADGLRAGVMPPAALLARLGDPAAYRRSFAALRAMLGQGVRIIPSHDARAAEGLLA